MTATGPRVPSRIVLNGENAPLMNPTPLDKPALRMTYGLEEVGEPTLADVLPSTG